GNDTLAGGAGTDYLDGGAGDDTYILNAGDGAVMANGATEAIVDVSGKDTLRVAGVRKVSAVNGVDLMIDYGTTDRVVVLKSRRWRDGGLRFPANNSEWRNAA
ncbi:hypothetical protein DFR35_0001, partial [Sulfurisoma sediminicola]